MKIESPIGFSGYGNATDKERGHDITSAPGVDPEETRVLGQIPAGSEAPLQFIYCVNDTVPPTLQLIGGGIAVISVKIYACLDRLARPDDSQNESRDVRPATWQEITAGYNIVSATGTAALASTGAAITNLLLSPGIPLAGALRANWIKIVLTPDGSSADDDVIDLYSHATSN
jgi:hypothetical protein